MDWASLKFYIDRMSKEELKRPVEVFDPYFSRVAKVVAIDSLDSAVNGNPGSSGSPTVLILSKDRR